MGTKALLIVGLGLSLGTAAIVAHSAEPDPIPQYTLHSFRKIQLTDKFWSEGVAIADLNRDGHPDIIAGPYWYEGPDFSRRHEIFPATQTFTINKEDGTEERVEGFEGALGRKNAYSSVQFIYVADFNGDGWPDVLMIGFPGTEMVWYENPGESEGKDKPWKRHIAFDAVGSESPAFVDLLKDGRPVVVCTSGDLLGYVAPDPGRLQERWRFHAVSTPLRVLREPREFFGTKEFPYVHGIGYGDVNGDGRLDILEPEGWWEQPAILEGDPIWRFHRWNFFKPLPTRRPGAHGSHGAPARESDSAIRRFYKFFRWPYAFSGAQLHVSDVNGDGRPDIVSSLDAHGYGLAWFEQLPGRDSSGEIRFRPHIIMGNSPHSHNKYGVAFTQLHALDMVDVDGDGLNDIVTGKRFWAHGPSGFSVLHQPDPESGASAVLYWFRLERRPDKSVRFVPYLIDADSGVGTQIATGDLKGDGLTDIAIANKKGTFVFLQEKRRVNQREWAAAQPRIHD